VQKNSYFRQRVTRLFIVCLPFFLAACVTTPRTGSTIDGDVWQRNDSIFIAPLAEHAKLTHWRYSAKVAIVSEQVKEQANLVWQNHQESNDIRLFGPFGLGAIKIALDENNVTLSDSKGVIHQGNNAEDLLRQTIGWSIPVDALNYWLFSLPLPKKQFDYQLNEQGQLSTLRQLGWTINYTAYKQYPSSVMPLARKIVATREFVSGQTVVVKLFAKNWKQSNLTHNN